MSRKRMMARPIAPARRSRTRPLGAIAVAAIVIVVGLVAVSSLLAGGSGSQPSGSTAVAAVPTATPSISVESSPTPNATTPRAPRTPEVEPTPTMPRATPTPSDNSTPLPRRTPKPTSTPASGAPAGPDEFNLERQVIDIGFPLRPQSRYHYRDNFMEPREGRPDEYNHARIHKDGSEIRLHDGTDIYADVGQPLIAAFSGTVIDPKSRWRPWEQDRYGRTVVIVSDEPDSAGYTALYVHADHVWVAPGDHVQRGQVLGTVGRTGNADGTNVPSHLHFELRAPFLLDWSPLGEGRQIDAFDPFPSLVKADPKRN